MNIDEKTIRNRCADPVFERGRKYRNERGIQRIERFDDVVTAAVQGPSLYDLTVELGGDTIAARCTCPSNDAGECKHIVAVLLDVAADPTSDESGRVESVLRDVSVDDLRGFVRDALAVRPDLRDQFLAQFDDEAKPFEEYRAKIERLFDHHTQDYPVVTDAIISPTFSTSPSSTASANATWKRRPSIESSSKGSTITIVRIAVASDHYAKALRSALDDP